MPMHRTLFDDPPYNLYGITLKQEYEHLYPEEGGSLLHEEGYEPRIVWYEYTPRGALREFLRFVDRAPERVFGLSENPEEAKAQSRQWRRRNTRMYHFNVTKLED